MVEGVLCTRYVIEEEVKDPQRAHIPPRSRLASGARMKAFLQRNGSFAEVSLAEKVRWNAVAVAAGSLSRLLSGIVVARLLGPELNGRYAFLIWLVEAIVLLCHAGMPGALNRFLALHFGRAEAEAAQNIVRFGLLAGMALSLTVALATFGVVYLYFFSEQTAPGLAASLGLLAAAQLWTGLAQSMLMGLHQFRAYARAVTVAALVLVIGQGVGASGWGLPGAIYGGLASYAVAAVLLTRAVAKGARWESLVKAGAPRMERSFLLYARDTWLAALISAVVWGRTELFFLERFSVPQEAGYFAVGLIFSSLIVQAVNLISGALLPHLSSLVGARETVRLQDDYRRISIFIALFTFPATLGGIALLPELMTLVFGPAYAGAIPAAQWLMSTGLLAFATVGSAVVYGQGDAHIIRNWSLLGAGLLSALCVLLAPAYGAAGVAAARVAVQVTMVAIGFYLLRSLYRLPVPVLVLFKLLFASIACGLGASAMVHLVGGVAGIALAVVAGTITYLVALRALGAIPSEDAAALQRLCDRLPTIVRKPGNKLLALVSPQ